MGGELGVGVGREEGGCCVVCCDVRGAGDKGCGVMECSGVVSVWGCGVVMGEVGT